MFLELYYGMVNSPVTVLSVGVDLTTEKIFVADASKLPDAPNIAVIGTDENAETIRYSAKEGDTLVGCMRGFQGQPQNWAAGSKIARRITEYDQRAIIDNLNRIDDKTGDSVRKVNGITPAPVDGSVLIRTWGNLLV